MLCHKISCIFQLFYLEPGKNFSQADVADNSQKQQVNLALAAVSWIVAGLQQTEDFSLHSIVLCLSQIAT